MHDPFNNPTGVVSRVRTSYVDGGAAGPLVLTGIRARGDRIISVWNITTPEDLTAEFSISDDDEIDNTGGTATTEAVLAVAWYDNDWGELVNAPWIDDSV